MKYLSTLLLFAGFLACAPCRGEEAVAAKAPADEGHSILHKVALYIPNRVLDLLDIIRLRVRVGPGIAADARVTKLVAVDVGVYDTVQRKLLSEHKRSSLELMSVSSRWN